MHRACHSSKYIIHHSPQRLLFLSEVLPLRGVRTYRDTAVGLARQGRIDFGEGRSVGWRSLPLDENGARCSQTLLIFGDCRNRAGFAAAHAHFPSFVPLFVLGGCFAIAYEWSDSILVSMTMHALFNSLTLTALAFPEIISQ